MPQTSSKPTRKRPGPRAFIDGVLRGDRVMLARAVTVIESDLPADAALAAQILEGILHQTGNARRVGITGVPGCGKSTFIDTLGIHLIRDLNQNVAVLSVDPSSPISGGSILGDKTRMERLSTEERAFIRPSPARGHLGGVARRTREAILLCEAAGYQNILVETVGVGQSETAVRSMTDFFLLLMLPGAGDELQGIKRGILELIDAIAVNKADGDNRAQAERTRTDYANALHLLPANLDGWKPPVICVSALTAENIPKLWKTILDHRAHLESRAQLKARRSQQALSWMREMILQGLEDHFRRHPQVASRLPALEADVQAGRTSAFTAAREILATLTSRES